MTNNEIVEIGSMLWSRYSFADKSLKVVTDEKDDGSLDWLDFHETRLTNAKNEKEFAWNLYTRFKDEYRDIINESFGI